jgi:hypothetical protein
MTAEAYFAVDDLPWHEQIRIRAAQRTKENQDTVTLTNDPLGARRARLQREIREAQLQLDALEFVPETDSYPDGTVIRASVLNPGQRDPLTYLFLRIDSLDHNVTGRGGVRWYHTGYIGHAQGNHATQKLRTYFDGWPELQTWLSEPKRVVESWEILTTPCTRDHTPRDAATGRSHESIHADVLDVLRAEYGFTASSQTDKPYDAALDHQLSELAHKILRVDGVL